ncbi:MAG: hypothetical protein C4293_11155, partial [Nitrospiraceae bacterium]
MFADSPRRLEVRCAGGQNLVIVLTITLGTVRPPSVSAELIWTQDREEIGRLRVLHNRSAEDVDALVKQVEEAGARGLPQEPLLNKIKEGLAKGVEPKQIESVLRDMAG